MNWKEPQTGKKTVTAADLKPGMYFRHTTSRGLRQLVKINGFGEGVYHVIDCADGSQGNHGSLETLALSFGSLCPIYELLDEQPTLNFLPKPVKCEQSEGPTPAPRAPGFDPYAVFSATYGKQTLQFVEPEPEPTVTEIQLGDGTTIVITTPGK